MRIAVIIPAAGQSTRYQHPQTGESRSKLDEDLGGKSVLQRTIELFHTRDEVASIIVAGPPEPEAFADFKLRHGDRLSLFGAKLCPGSPRSRAASVAAALSETDEKCTHFAVHDAARPCTSSALIDRVFDAATKHDAVIPAIPVDDTLKRVGEPIDQVGDLDPVAAILGSGAEPPPLRPVVATVDRTDLVLVQTPQVFEASLFRRAYAGDLTGTDDAALVEVLEETVLVIEGDRRNLKITRPGDLELARAILGLGGPRSRPTHKRF
jgi:2-C-methyl-D-erythritol 4-phosphate cytidylyltransferase